MNILYRQSAGAQSFTKEAATTTVNQCKKERNISAKIFAESNVKAAAGENASIQLDKYICYGIFTIACLFLLNIVLLLRICWRAYFQESDAPNSASIISR